MASTIEVGTPFVANDERGQV